MTDLQELMALLETCRDYVATALHEERQKFAGHEHCSDIPDMEADLAKIDAALRSPAFAEMARDAERWRALVGSARVRVLGSAGLRSEVDPYGKPWDGRAHIGLELWTKHSPADNEPTDAVQWLTKYADIAVDAAASGGDA